MSNTTMMVLMIRHKILIHVNLRILEVILMVVQKIFVKNIKMKKMTITLTLHIKIDTIESDLQEEVRNRILSKKNYSK